MTREDALEKAKRYFFEGIAAMEGGAFEAAEQAFRQALDFAPGRNSIITNLASALVRQQKYKEALDYAQQSVAGDPHNVEGLLSLGICLSEYVRDRLGAVAVLDKALAIDPHCAEAWSNRGGALTHLKRHEEALDSCNKALSLNPDYAEAWNNLGNALADMRRYEEALPAYEKALSLHPDDVEALNNLGATLQKIKRLEEALVNYESALSLNPDGKFLFGLWLHVRMKLCDWDGFAGNLRKYETDIAEDRQIVEPFGMLALLDAPALHKQAARAYAMAEHPESHALGACEKRKPGGKIRIGYYSADFHNHATAYLMAEVFEAHDAGTFELYGFSFGPPANDAMRQRVSAAFHTFIDVRDMSDRDVAALSREWGIDIAVDLKGYTEDARPGMFAARCAPVQVNYLGYPGTMGVPYIDYVIADKVVIPPERQSDYTERVVYLPHSYQCNDSTRGIAERGFTKAELGLPETGCVFCCFNNNHKILPATFDGWMRLLKAVDDSVLWLLEDSPAVVGNLRREAQARGIDGNRLVFAKRLPPDEHLARHRLADLFIDTLPYNAHTTASDALWAGLPVLTLAGQSFAARVAASLLHAVGLPELVTHTQEAYEAKAIALATHPAELQALKDKLMRNRLTMPLFDGTLFTRHLEAAYVAMHERSQAGLSPDVIEVQP